MRIPSESNIPYIIELTDRPLPDNNRAEAVGEPARAGSALSQAPSRQTDAQRQTTEEAAATPAVRPATVERRKEERRKEQRFILLDTRASRRCRRSGRYAAVNLKI